MSLSAPRDYYLRAFLQHWATFDIDIEQMYLLVSLHDIAFLVDPYEGVLHSSILGRLMDPDIDMQIRMSSLSLEA